MWRREEDSRITGVFLIFCTSFAVAMRISATRMHQKFDGITDKKYTLRKIGASAPVFYFSGADAETVPLYFIFMINPLPDTKMS